MKKLPIILAAAGLLFTGVNARAEGGSLVVLGDSIASGYGLSGYTAGDNYSAPDSFANRLGELYPEYRNFAQDGLTTDGLLTKLEDEETAAALSGADTVVVSIGGNDFLQPMLTAVITEAMENPDLIEALQGGDGDLTEYLDIMRELTDKLTSAAEAVDTAAVGDNAGEILGTVRELNPDCEIIILTVYNPFEDVEGMELFDVTAREKLAELNSEIAAAAEQNGAQVADVFTLFQGNAEKYTNIAAMDIHPSKDGHGAIYSLLTGLADIPAARTDADPAKPSPDTGVGGIAALCGIVLVSGGIAAVCGKRR